MKNDRSGSSSAFTCEVPESARGEGDPRLSAIIDNLPGVVYRARNNSSWTMEFLGGRVEELTGYRAEDLIADERISFGALIHPEDRERVCQEVRSALHSGERFRLEYRIRTAAGEEKCVREQGEGVCTDDGEPRAVEGFIMDVTEQKRTEEKRDEARSQLEATLDATADGILVLDRKGRTRNCNRRFTEIWDIPDDIARHPDLRARLAYVAGQLENPKGFIEHARRVVSDPHGIHTDVLRFKDGRVFERRSRPQKIDGRTVGRVFSFRDVTKQRRAEERERERVRDEAVRREAEAAQKRIRDILESITDGFFAVDERWCFTYVNREIERLSGMGREELLGRELWEALSIPAGSRFRAEYHRAVAEQVPVEFEEHDPLRGLWLRARAYPYQEGLVVYVRDVTGRREVESALRTAKEEAEKASRAKSEFLSRTSHELRTPLNAILGFAQILEMDVEGDVDREHVGEILQAGRHLLSLVDELLELEMAEAGRMDVSLEVLDIGGVMADAISRLQPLAAERGVRMPEALPDACGHRVRADRKRIEQVLLNLLSNAIQYNREDGRVSVTCREADGRLRVRIHDTGRGIPPERIDRLFMPFERAGAELTQKQGAGLGLSIARAFMEAMGGEVGLESTSGNGSTFRIELPLAGQDRSSADARDAPRQGE